MERRLVVMRHAKSSWKSVGAADRDRPLNKRGMRDAPRVAARLASLGWTPDVAFVSDAVRTRQTWQRLVGAWPRVPATFLGSFYLGGLGRIREASARWDAGWTTVLVLGHNPGWEDAVTALSGGPTHLATGCAALLVGSGSTWAAALDGPWTRFDVVRPREI